MYVTLAKVHNYAKQNNYTVNGVSQMYVRGKGTTTFNAELGYQSILVHTAHCIDEGATRLTFEMTREDGVIVSVDFSKDELTLNRMGF